MKTRFVIGATFKNKIGKEFTILDEERTEKSYKTFIIKFKSGYVTKVTYPAVVSGSVTDYLSETYNNIGILGYYKDLKPTRQERDLWSSMLDRCYNENHPSFIYYGARGVTVSERWKRFDYFIQDIREMLPKGNYLDFELDKDISKSKVYSDETCCFIPSNVNKVLTSRNRKFYAKTPDGSIHSANIVKYFANKYNLDDSSIQKCLRGKRKHHKNFTFSYNIQDLQEPVTTIQTK